MIMKRLGACVVVLALLGVPSTVLGAPVLQEVLFNLNGTTYHNTYAVPGLNSAGWDDSTGLGTLMLTFNPGSAGSYFFDAFFDHQVHGPFYNEYGVVNGVPAAGVSWQIDEPGFGDGNRTGTIFANASANALDNTNHIPGTLSNFGSDCGANTPGNLPDAACNNDVSMALGFNFILAADELAVITINGSQSLPAGFSLQQVDPDTPDTVFLSGSISFQQRPVPEPGMILLLGIGAAARFIRRSGPTSRRAA
jgi:hypothetical protein